MSDTNRPRLLVFVVAYNAEQTIHSVLNRIPSTLTDPYEVEVLIIDDASQDATFEKSWRARKASAAPFPIRVLFNPVNQGYGGNQKLGYHYAIENGFDFVALLHGDGQYAPERLPDLLEPLRKGEADAVFGSRMLTPTKALEGGMPLYKFIGNRILTWFQNKLLRSSLSEFHSGYRLYSVQALQSIPFERNTNQFHFDTEIIVQLMIARKRIVELPIPTYYGDEICHVDGIKYAKDVALAVVKARLQELSLFYDRRFDCAPPQSSPYTAKLNHESPHSLAVDRVRAGSKVLDLGCAGGYLSRALRRQKRCVVTAVDLTPVTDGAADLCEIHDLNQGPPEFDEAGYQTVLMLDVIEHLMRPEEFLEDLRRKMAVRPTATLLISTANIGFVISRVMLLAGQFNYGKRGILDLTHTRLFTFASMRRALEQAGFAVVEARGVPAPFPLAIGDNVISRMLLRTNQILIRLSRGLFAYQIFMVAKPQPTLETLFHDAQVQSRIRTEVIETFGVDDRAALQTALRTTAAATLVL